MTFPTRLLLLAALASLSAACWPDPPGDPLRDNHTAALADAGTTQACGVTTCGASQICVHPCCGGAPPQCEAASDAGTCAFGPCNVPGSALPCSQRPCSPPAPYCVTVPTSCGGAASCGCLGADVCRGAGSCGAVGADGVSCVCA